MKRRLGCLLILFLLTSCGGGGGNSVSSFETPTLTAYYGDAPVKGLIYEASPSGLNGVTDERGAFNFKQGDHVSFYIDPVNRIYLGKVNPKRNEYIIPSIDSVYDAEVESLGVNLLLFTFDKSGPGSAHMDLSGLMLTSGTANNVKDLLARKKLLNQSGELWQVMQSLQDYVQNYTYKNSGVNSNYIDFYNSMSSMEFMDNLAIELNDYHGVFVYNSAGTSNIYLNFLLGGGVTTTHREGDLSTGTFTSNDSSITIRWDNQSNTQCDLLLNLKKRGLQWSLMSSKNANTPLGCDPISSIVSIPYRSAKISSAMSISRISGKQLQIPVKALCGLGDGEVIFNISLSGISSDQRVVNIPASVCTGDVPIDGAVRETGLPGVLIFEFDSLSPKQRLIFSVLEESQRAAIQLSFEKNGEIGNYENSNAVETSFVLN